MKRKVKRSKVRRSSSRVNNKKKKFNWNILIWIVLGLIVLGVIYYSVNSITGNTITGMQTVAQTQVDDGLMLSCWGLDNVRCDSASSGLTAAGCDIASAVKCGLGSIAFTRHNLSSVLLGILLWMILYSVVKSMFGKGGENWERLFSGAIALIITILAFMFLPDNFIDAIVIQYGAMGAAILSIIPFIIILYFSLWVSSSLLVARAVWIFYIIYYFMLFIYQLASITPTETATWWMQSLPYWGAILAGIFIFFALPGIRNLVIHGKLEALKESGKGMADRAKLLHQLQRRELEKGYGA